MLFNNYATATTDLQTVLDDLIICGVWSHLARSCWKKLRENEDFKKRTSFLLGFGAGHPVVVAYFMG